MAEVKKTPNLGLAISTDESIKFKDWHKIINGEGPVKENEDDAIALVEKSNVELLDSAYAELQTETERAKAAEEKIIQDTSDNFEAVKDEIEVLTDEIQTETERAKAAESELATIKTSLEDEITRAKTAENQLVDDMQTSAEQVDEALQQVMTTAESKQDKLIAGDNITIENNIISAKGGTSLTAGTGIDITDSTISVDETYLNEHLSPIEEKIEQIGSEISGKADVSVTTDEANFVDTLTVNKNKYSIFNGARPELNAVMTKTRKSGHTVPVTLWNKIYNDTTGAQDLYNDFDAFTSTILDYIEKIKRVGFIAKCKLAEVEGMAFYDNLVFTPATAMGPDYFSQESLNQMLKELKEQLANCDPADLQAACDVLDPLMPYLRSYAYSAIQCTSHRDLNTDIETGVFKQDNLSTTAFPDLSYLSTYEDDYLHLVVSLGFLINATGLAQDITVDDVNLNIKLKLN